MSTKSVHERWASRFAETKAWVEAHGRLPRITSDASAHERALSAWVVDQRARHLSGFLPVRHVEALRDVGGILDPHPITHCQEELKAWVAAHGRRPGSSKKDPVEAAFAGMVNSLRRYAVRGKLKLGAVELLLSVPGVLDDEEKELVLSRLGAKLEARRSAGGATRANTDPLEAKWNRVFNELSAGRIRAETVAAQRHRSL